MVSYRDKVSLVEYLEMPETNRPYELAYGVLREPPAPNWDHQIAVGRLFERLDAHVTRFGLGKIGLSPLDVILDAEKHLVLQPDLVFVSAERVGIIREQIWGAPDLVVEVVSPSSRQYDREQKRAWYAQYGVRELWLVDPRETTVAIDDLTTPAGSLVTYTQTQILRSRVLPRLRLLTARAFI
jgi:Uma2 family endonuclease